MDMREKRLRKRLQQCQETIETIRHQDILNVFGEDGEWIFIPRTIDMKLKALLYDELIQECETIKFLLNEQSNAAGDLLAEHA